MRNTWRIGGGVSAGWRLLTVVAALLVSAGFSNPAQAEEPVDCDGVSVELVDHFANPICYMSRFRSGGAIGRNQSIHGESRDYMINFQSSRSGAGHTYLYAIDFETLLGFYGLTEDQANLNVVQEAKDGFEYISVGGGSLDSCILFLKQSRPIRRGYRAQYYGLACDKNKLGEYTPEDAIALLDMIKDY